MSNRLFIRGGGLSCDYEDRSCRMGIRVFLAALIFVTLLSATTWSQSPYIIGPAGSTSQPVSQTQQGLFRSPNWYDSGGNDVITGNVRGGRHFRGNVPYQSSTSFRGSVPSGDTLYSFMRYSAGSEDFARGSGKYRQPMPYYNPSQTVTFTRPGQSRVYTPTSASVIKSASSGTGLEFIRSAQSSGQILGGTASGPMSMSLQETERLISAEVGGLVGPGSQFAGDGVSMAGAVRQRAADLRIKPIGEEEIQQPFELDGKSYVEASVLGEDTAVRRIEREQMREQLLARRQIESEDFGGTSASSIESLRRAIDASVSGKEVTAGEGGEQQDLFDTYTRVKKQIDDLQETLERLRGGKGAGEAPSTKSVSGYGQATAPKGTSGLRSDGLERWETADTKKIPEQVDFQYSGNDTELQAFRRNIERLAAESERMDKFTAAGISSEAKRILGGRSVEAFSEDRFKEYMKAAGIYQKQGRHYRAVSAYTLASVYKPGEALAYAGRSHALFAAGEYMSSALHLSRALEISPEYAKTKVDFLAILGTDDKEQLNNRIAEIEQWYKKSDEADLKFLLGYIYCQVGEIDKAKEAIDTARTRMSNLSAVDALMKVIENK